VQLFYPMLSAGTIFAWGENSPLHKLAVGSTGKLTYVAQSHQYASVEIRGDAPGDANAQVVNGRVLVL
jgi:hypothetical protein